MRGRHSCEAELAQKFGFAIDALDAEGIPIGICDKPAKNSIVSKQSDTIGGNIKQIIRVCDEHFDSLQEAWEESRHKHLASYDDIVTEKGRICPCCGEKAETYRSRLRFRKNRI